MIVKTKSGTYALGEVRGFTERLTALAWAGRALAVTQLVLTALIGCVLILHAPLLPKEAAELWNISRPLFSEKVEPSLLITLFYILLSSPGLLFLFFWGPKLYLKMLKGEWQYASPKGFLGFCLVFWLNGIAYNFVEDIGTTPLFLFAYFIGATAANFFSPVDERLFVVVDSSVTHRIRTATASEAAGVRGQLQGLLEATVSLAKHRERT